MRKEYKKIQILGEDETILMMECQREVAWDEICGLRRVEKGDRYA